MKSDFSYFVKRCKYYQKKFNLMNWLLLYKYEEPENEDAIAEVFFSTNNYTGTIYLNPDKNLSKKRLDLTAKHEILHILIGRLYINAKDRFVPKDEITSSCEEIIQILCNLL